MTRKSFLPNRSASRPTTGMSGIWVKAYPEKMSPSQLPVAPISSANLASSGLTMPMPAMLMSTASQTTMNGLLRRINCIRHMPLV